MDESGSERRNEPFADAGAGGGDSLWYKDAIIYELHVKAFFDSNNDGIGDFAGLIRKLDYLQDLGVTALWLLPFYPSPMKDDGYDISDYRNVHPDYGNRAVFRQFVREAHRRGLKVITELVINHTSDCHPWFQAARRAPPGSNKRNFYVWSDTRSRYAGTRIIFSDTETSNWARDEVAQAFYWHRFFSHQPDLNFDNPTVRKAVIRVMRSWLDMGVDGMRLDAIPYLCVREGTSNENLPETHAAIKEIRAVIDAHYRDRMLLAEANQWPEDVRDYFADGDECHMAYHFPLMPRMYMAIAQEDRHPIVEIMHQTPEIPDSCQWAIFLRNHDELTLEMVTSKERDYMYQMYAADSRARINLGIRRRLAPLMDNDPDKIKLMNALVMSMPGSPIIYYGDELGMGDNIYLGDRNGVRTPMQWSPDRNAGFSQADPQRLYLPPIMDAVYGYSAVNVEAQARDPSSLLNWTRRLLSVRKGHPAFGRGTLQFLRPDNRKILAFLREYGDEVLLCVTNLSRSAQPVQLDLARHKGRVPMELFGRTPFPPIGDLPYLVTLPGHGFFWFRLAADEEARSWLEERLAREEPPLLVFFDGWHSLFRDRVMPWRIAMAERVRRQFENEVLPRFVAVQRWFAGKEQGLEKISLRDHVEWTEARGSWLLALFDIVAGDSVAYFMPLGLAWEDEDAGNPAQRAATVARVRQQARLGVLGDACADEDFSRALVEAIGAGRVFQCTHGSIRCTPTAAFARLLEGTDPATLAVGVPSAQSTNSAVIINHKLFLKFYRRLHGGVGPELEMGRFLTEVAGFAHCVPVAGAVEYIARDAPPTTLALLQEYVDNQGDGWTFTVEYLDRVLENCRATGSMAAAGAHGAYLALVATLGRRTAELHLALSMATDDPAFAAEPVQPDDIDAWRERLAEEAQGTLERLERRLDGVPAGVRPAAVRLVERRSDLLARIRAPLPQQGALLKVRHHGDFHLGQVLLAQNDFIIIDFEGEPGRSLEERRRKHSPLRDVAGMLRSFDYAARTAIGHVSSDGTDKAQSVFEPTLDAWQQEAGQAFLESYAATVADSALYGDWPAARRLLELFLLEKACYELRYELDHRPEWVHVPINSLLSALDRAIG